MSLLLRRMGPPGVTSRPLLDLYPGAAAAFSLRKLSSATTNVIRVRREGDNAEANFTASDVSGGAVSAWLGNAVGYVVTWYDQSGNGRNATQGTSANCPIIQSSLGGVGTPVIEGGLPALQFLDAFDSLSIASITTGSWFTVLRSSVGSTGGSYEQFILGSSTSYFWHADYVYWLAPYASAQSNWLNGASANLFTTARTTSRVLLSGVMSSAVTAPLTLSRDRAEANGRSLVGTRQEVIIYPDNRTPQREGIERNINAYYRIY